MLAPNRHFAVRIACVATETKGKKQWSKENGGISHSNSVEIMYTEYRLLLLTKKQQHCVGGSTLSDIVSFAFCIVWEKNALNIWWNNRNLCYTSLYQGIHRYIRFYPCFLFFASIATCLCAFGAYCSPIHFNWSVLYSNPFKYLLKLTFCAFFLLLLLLVVMLPLPCVALHACMSRCFYCSFLFWHDSHRCAEVHRRRLCHRALFLRTKQPSAHCVYVSLIKIYEWLK